MFSRSQWGDVFYLRSVGGNKVRSWIVKLVFLPTWICSLNHMDTYVKLFYISYPLLGKYTRNRVLLDVCPLMLCVAALFQGDRETFESYYRKQRKKQARLVLQPQSNMVSAFCFPTTTTPVLLSPSLNVPHVLFPAWNRGGLQKVLQPDRWVGVSFRFNMYELISCLLHFPELLFSLQVFCGGGPHIARHARFSHTSVHRRAVEHGPIQNNRRSPHTLGE